MAKHRASTISVDALKAERTEAMNSFYHFEQFNARRIPIDVFGKRARDIRKRDIRLMNDKLRNEYNFALGSPAKAVEFFENYVVGMGRLLAA